MRNLKRALSLTLASVMLLGMMVVGSSALSFNDAEDISNVTAATVLQELGVMIGNDGNFMPDAPVSRAQMAILICRVLYGDKLNISQFAGTTQYTDVPAYEYYNGYVNLATSLGIINGYGDGRFGPDDTVTTAQAALMLCRALGYFKANEMTGDWAQDSLTAIAQATKIDMFGDLKLNTNEPLSRDNVAEMVFNTMTKAVPVHYSERWDVYYTDSQSILSGVEFKYNNTLGYQNFDLVYNEKKSDDFERPATEWGTGTVKDMDDKGNIESATIKTSFLKAADEADATYTAKVKAKDLYGDLDLSEKTDAAVYVDGKEAADFSITKSGETEIGGNGVLVEAYKNDDGEVTITVINPYVGEISRVTPAKDNDARTVKVDNFSKAYETEGFEEDDIVVYTVAKGEIQSMYLAETTTDVEVTRTKGTSEFVAGGDTYKYATKWAKVDDTTDLVDDKKDVKTENRLDLYLDNYGYVVKVDLTEGVTDYAYVLDIGEDSTRFDDGTPYAKLLLSDGTVVEAELDYDDYTSISNKSGMETAFEFKIVEYSKDSKDVYELTAKGTALTALTTGQKVTVDSGKSKVTLGTNTVYADSKTIFLTDDGDDNYAAYTGYDAVPDLEGVYTGAQNYASYAYYCESGSVATVVYVLNSSSSSDDIVFLLASECSAKISSTDGDDYFECPAVVNGEIVDVKLNKSVKDSKTNILLKTIVYDNEKEEIIDVGKSKLYSTTTTDDNYYISGTVTKKLTNNNLTIDGTSIGVASDAQVFVYDDEIKDSSKASIAAGDTGYFVVNDGRIVTIFYKEADSGNNEDPEPVETGDSYVDLATPGTVKVYYKVGTTAPTKDQADALVEAAIVNAGYTVSKSVDDNTKITYTASKGSREATFVWTYGSGILEAYVGTIDNKETWVRGTNLSGTKLSEIVNGVTPATGKHDKVVAGNVKASLTGTPEVGAFVASDVVVLGNDFAVEAGYISLDAKASNATSALTKASVGTAINGKDWAANTNQYVKVGDTITVTISVTGTGVKAAAAAESKIVITTTTGFTGAAGTESKAPVGALGTGLNKFSVADTISTTSNSAKDDPWTAGELVFTKTIKAADMSADMTGITVTFTNIENAAD